MASPSGSPLLETSKRSSSDLFKSSSIQSIEERVEASQFSMVMLESETSAQIGEANMGVMRSGHFWQLNSIAFPATETTGGEILVAL